MKKKLLIAAAVLCAGAAGAQNIMPENDMVPQTNGFPIVVEHRHWLSRICFDLNVMGGSLKDKINYTDLTRNYPDALNTKVSGVKFRRGSSESIDAEVGFFFDREGRYGVGTGLMFAQQYGHLTLDNFHIEYKSTDNFNNTFRQSLTSIGQIDERMNINTISIPLLFKYKLKLNEMFGFNADAGLLFNINERVHYKTNAAFNYEAIYQYSGTQGNLVPVYDFSAVPAAGDVLLTQSQYLQTNAASGLQNYFNTLRSEGYNVGLNVKPGNKGTVSSVKGSVGILLRPSVNVVMSHAISITAGVYYMYDGITHNTPASYRLTDKVGQYDPLSDAVSKAHGHSMGITLGGSYSFSRMHHHTAMVVPIEDTSSIAPEEEEDKNERSPVLLNHMSHSEPNLQADLQPVYHAAGEAERREF